MLLNTGYDFPEDPEKYALISIKGYLSAFASIRPFSVLDYHQWWILRKRSLQIVTDRGCTDFSD